MAIDWASDHFVRLYTRETEDDLLLSWEARAVWNELLKKFDKQGHLVARKGARTIAAMIRYPVEVVERALPDLLQDGRLEPTEQGYLAPNYQPANYTPRAAAARKAYSRERTQIGSLPVDGCSDTKISGAQIGQRAVGGCPESVSESHSESLSPGENGSSDYKLSRGVTPSHVASIRSGQIRSEHAQDRRAQARDRRRGLIPRDWLPSEPLRARAQELELDWEVETREFVAYWIGEGKAKADWDSTFLARIEHRGEQLKRMRSRGEPAGEPRKLDDL